MYFRSYIISLVLLCSTVLTRSEEAPAVVVADHLADRLLRANLTLTSRYRPVAEKLGVTPFNCGRVIYLHPFSGEESVSVYSRTSQDATVRYQITYLKADQNLYHLTDEGRTPSAVNRARVTRIDAGVPESTAKLIRRVWMRTLRQARGTYPPPRDQWEAVPADSTQLEFSLQTETTTTQFGLLNTFLATQRPKVEKLLRISKSLISYSQGSAQERQGIAREIDNQANELLALFR